MKLSLYSTNLGDMANTVVAVVCAESKKLWVFDAPAGVGEWITQWSGYTCEGLFLTHGHYDHILGIGDLQPKQTFGHEGDKIFFETPRVMAPWMDPSEASQLRPCGVTTYLKGGEKLNVAGLEVEVRPSPGHSKGGVIFYLPQLKAALTGDTLFKEGVGRTDLPGGSWEALENSIRTQIYTLPEDTELYPGHGHQTRVGYEKTHNPYVSA